MIRRIIIVGTVLCVPVIIYLAMHYGKPPNVSFAEAIDRTQHTSESDPASKVLVDVVITDASDPAHIIATDSKGQSFTVEYTGTAPDSPMQTGMRVHFVGHVHGGQPPIFHATQMLLP